MSQFSQNHKKSKIPETVTGVEGSAKRNIIRKGGVSHSRKDGIAGAVVDDGSLYNDPYALDRDDPNYDSEEDLGDNIPTYGALHRENIAKSKMTLTQYKKVVQPVIQEFFTSGDLDEVVARLNVSRYVHLYSSCYNDSLFSQEIDAPEYSYEFVKRLINTSIDLGDQQREQVSQLLSALYPDILSMNMIGKGFERLFEIVDEIEIDAPQAGNMIASFIARAVIDEVLPPSFLSDSVVRNLGGDIIGHAILLLSRDHAGAKLERIWGPGDGRPVEEMKIAVDQLLGEYLLSSDFEEAERCLRELHAPQFHHEVVKRAVTLALDKTEDNQIAMSKLLANWSVINLLSIQQAEKGFNRLFKSISDIVLDVPNARSVLDAFLERAKTDGVVGSSYTPVLAENFETTASN